VHRILGRRFVITARTRPREKPISIVSRAACECDNAPRFCRESLRGGEASRRSWRRSSSRRTVTPSRLRRARRARCRRWGGCLDRPGRVGYGDPRVDGALHLGDPGVSAAVDASRVPLRQPEPALQPVVVLGQKRATVGVVRTFRLVVVDEQPARPRPMRCARRCSNSDSEPACVTRRASKRARRFTHESPAASTIAATARTFTISASTRARSCVTDARPRRRGQRGLRGHLRVRRGGHAAVHGGGGGDRVVLGRRGAPSSAQGLVGRARGGGRAFGGEDLTLDRAQDRKTPGGSATSMCAA